MLSKLFVPHDGMMGFDPMDKDDMAPGLSLLKDWGKGELMLGGGGGVKKGFYTSHGRRGGGALRY